MNIQIELAKREDYSDMITLADLTLPDRMNKHELKKYFELFPDLIFKATYGGRLIGFSCAGIDMTQHSGWMLFSNVDPAFQGQGIGKRLIEARVSALRSFPSLEEIWVTVHDSNVASIKALQAFGFQWSHLETDYYGPGKHRSMYRLPILQR